MISIRTNEIPEEAARNPAIFDSYVKAASVLSKHENAVCSISGGADSDVMMDIISRLDADGKVDYVFFDTGLEYRATKDHLDYLEDTYHRKIERKKPVKSVPTCCREFGIPFLSKQVSERIEILQRHGFRWEDKEFEVLTTEYTRCNDTLKWWCNRKGFKGPDGEFIPGAIYNISRNKWLKEFLISNPPPFPVSAKCCTYAKKKVAKDARKGYQLEIVGIRRAEGGVRSTAYKSCYGNEKDGVMQYRPLFWYRDQDKKEYDELFQIRHSDCYSVYGLKRTGCVGCPYGVRWNKNEIETVAEYEPLLYRACSNVFGKSYEYTQKYFEFVRERDAGKERA